MTHRDEEQAFRRVEQLKTRGYWPGVVRTAGGWVLTFDPDLPGDGRPQP